jgi:hypothetical protein
MEALGLELKDIPAEIARKEESIDALIGNMDEADDEDRGKKMEQLRMMERELGHMTTMLQTEGGSLGEIADIEKLQEKINVALAN